MNRQRLWYILLWIAIILLIALSFIAYREKYFACMEIFENFNYCIFGG